MPISKASLPLRYPATFGDVNPAAERGLSGFSLLSEAPVSKHVPVPKKINAFVGILGLSVAAGTGFAVTALIAAAAIDMLFGQAIAGGVEPTGVGL